MSFGFMGKFIYIDRTNYKISEEVLDKNLAREFIGGYGIEAKLLYENQDGHGDLLSPENMLRIFTGLLTDTPLPFVSRFTAIGKSPLTNCWGNANGNGLLLHNP